MCIYPTIYEWKYKRGSYLQGARVDAPVISFRNFIFLFRWAGHEAKPVWPTSVYALRRSPRQLPVSRGAP